MSCATVPAPLKDTATAAAVVAAAAAAVGMQRGCADGSLPHPRTSVCTVAGKETTTNSTTSGIPWTETNGTASTVIQEVAEVVAEVAEVAEVVEVVEVAEVVEVEVVVQRTVGKEVVVTNPA